MECPRGSTLQESSHEVKTLEKASEWLRREAKPEELPLKINQWKAKNGRLRVEIYDCQGNLLTKRG